MTRLDRLEAAKNAAHSFIKNKLEKEGFKIISPLGYELGAFQQGDKILENLLNDYFIPKDSNCINCGKRIKDEHCPTCNA